jgi:GNAT superfamily N-acetyltransferase
MVHPVYQRQGPGRKLIYRLLQQAKADDIAIVTVTFQAAHQKVYETGGFQLYPAGIWTINTAG